MGRDRQRIDADFIDLFLEIEGFEDVGDTYLGMIWRNDLAYLGTVPTYLAILS